MRLGTTEKTHVIEYVKDSKIIQNEKWKVIFKNVAMCMTFYKCGLYTIFIFIIQYKKLEKMVYNNINSNQLFY